MNNDIIEVIDELFEVENPSLSEALFVEAYLPLIMSDDPSDFNDKWLTEVAINVNNKVDVIDTEGVVIFTVPSLAPNTTLGDPGGYYNLLTEVSAVRDMHRIKGENLIRNQLPHFYQFDSTRSQADIDTWYDIMTRYGYESEIRTNAHINSTPDSSDEMEEW